MKIYKPTPLKNLSWSQAKSRFPLMNPFGDADKDGVKNFKDCKPFDIKRQDSCPKCGINPDDSSNSLEQIKWENKHIKKHGMCSGCLSEKYE